jgi:hypothetical protein
MQVFMILLNIACNMQNMQNNMTDMQNMQTSFSICRICTAHFADGALRFRADVLAVTRSLRFRDWWCGLSGSAGRARAAGTFQKCGLSWPENMLTIRSCEGSVSAHLDIRHQMMMTFWSIYQHN